MKTPAARFQFIAGHVALDFVNTVANRGNPEIARDCFESGADFKEWVRLEGKLPEVRSAVGVQDLRRIRMLRETLHSIFQEIARGGRVTGQSLSRMNEAILKCRRMKLLVSDREGIRWGWAPDASPLDVALCKIVMDAAELVASDLRGSIKECAGAGCGWLFLDRSQAHKRKWCSMADCGNREKARQHYRRSGGG
jgi:predicted RNA-binding Zn ribbon-like protein